MDTKALRQKILDLAIRGKLVPQDPNDEPASVLLERIRAEKQQMVKDGKLKPKDIKNDTVIFKGDDNLHYEQFADGTVKCIEDEIPFDIPDGWAWCRLQTLCIKEIKRGKAPKYVDSSNTLVFAQKCNTKTGEINISIAKFLDERVLKKYNYEDYMQYNDIIINSTGTGTLGRVGIFKETDDINNQPIVPDTHITIVRVSSNISADYLFAYLKFNQNYFENSGEGSTNQKELKPKIIKNFLVAIPPLFEQQNITKTLKLYNEQIYTLDVKKAKIFATISAVKSKILDLAICGKLVPQDPNDEPASVLLERIRAEKEELIKQGKIKRDKKESVIFKGDDNSYYIQTGSLIEELGDWSLDCLPDSWGICCLGEVCDYGSCINVNTDCIEDDAWILDLEDIEKNTGRVIEKVKKSERSSMSTKHSFKKGQVLYSKLRPYLNKVVLADEDGYCTSEILPLDFNSLVLPAYARYYLMTPAFLAYANRCSYGVKMPRLSTSDGKKAVMTIPPLAEQKHIVAAIEIYYKELDKIAEMLA